jgi:hypothetical protein
MLQLCDNCASPARPSALLIAAYRSAFTGDISAGPEPLQ